MAFPQTSIDLLPFLQNRGGATWIPESCPLGDTRLGSISTDSRALDPQAVFVALRGEQFDGHAFLDQVQHQGGRVALVDDGFYQATPIPEQRFPHLSLIRVPDTLWAYQALGQGWREQFSRPIVGITGSVGKTTTKELIAGMLSQLGTVLKTQGNYNNEIGVPKTLLQLQPNHDYGVIEMAMRGRGQIDLLARLAQPTIAVITNVGVAHIELLGSREAIAEAKCELLAAMDHQGVAILNQDQPLLMNTAARVWSGKTITFGLQGGDVRGQLRDVQTLVVDDHVFHLPLPGEHNAVNFLAGLAVARELGIPWSALTHLNLTLPAGRSQRYERSDDVVLLDETYNAGPESMTAALKLLAQTPGDRHIAVLGTMKELGDRSLAFHQQVGQVVADLNLDALFILADPPEAEALAQGAHPVPSHVFETGSDLVQALKSALRPGDRLLFKASRAVALDHVVQALRQAE